jgi:hypothetical protein
LHSEQFGVSCFASTYDIYGLDSVLVILASREREFNICNWSQRERRPHTWDGYMGESLRLYFAYFILAHNMFLFHIRP